MTEVTWQEYVTPNQMLAFLERNATDRKLRLLVAAFRHIEHLITTERISRLLAEAKRFGVFYGKHRPGSPDCLLKAIEVVERCADELVAIKSLAPIAELADRLSSVGGFYFDCYDPSWGTVDYDLLATCEAASAVHRATSELLDLGWVATYASRAVYRAAGGANQNRGDPSEDLAQCRLIRDLFPFSKRSVSTDPLWRSSDVLALARQMYESRDFSTMPILADALQDAGCDDSEILQHCRGQGPHVHGCWFVDLVLEKS